MGWERWDKNSSKCHFVFQGNGKPFLPILRVICSQLLLIHDFIFQFLEGERNWKPCDLTFIYSENPSATTATICLDNDAPEPGKFFSLVYQDDSELLTFQLALGWPPASSRIPEPKVLITKNILKLASEKVTRFLTENCKQTNFIVS